MSTNEQKAIRRVFWVVVAEIARPDEQHRPSPLHSTLSLLVRDGTERCFSSFLVSLFSTETRSVWCRGRVVPCSPRTVVKSRLKQILYTPCIVMTASPTKLSTPIRFWFPEGDSVTVSLQHYAKLCYRTAHHTEWIVQRVIRSWEKVSLCRQRWHDGEGGNAPSLYWPVFGISMRLSEAIKRSSFCAAARSSSVLSRIPQPTPKKNTSFSCNIFLPCSVLLWAQSPRASPGHQYSWAFFRALQHGSERWVQVEYKTKEREIRLGMQLNEYKVLEWRQAGSHIRTMCNAEKSFSHCRSKFFAVVVTPSVKTRLLVSSSAFFDTSMAALYKASKHYFTNRDRSSRELFSARDETSHPGLVLTGPCGFFDSSILEWSSKGGPKAICLWRATCLFYEKTVEFVTDRLRRDG